MHTDTENLSKIKKSRVILISLIFIFGLPYAAAFYFFFDDSSRDQMNTSNNGLLISPVRPIPPIELQKIGAENKNQDSDVIGAPAYFSGHWTMLSVTSSYCDTQCIDNFYSLKQVRRALGVNRSQVHRAILLLDQDNIDSLISQLDEFQGMDILTAETNTLPLFLDYLKPKEENPSTPLENAIFLFDPQGNYMMFYPANTHPKLVLKDLETLMKIFEK